MYKDALTNTYNKKGFKVVSKKIIQTKKGFVVLFDIDNFKTINDCYGHTIGDKFLIKFANRVSKFLPIKSIFCRAGGDEFLLNVFTNELSISSFIKQIKEICLKPITINGNSLVVNVTLGIVEYPKYANTIDKLIDFADYSMYCSKRKKMFHIFSEKTKNQYLNDILYRKLVLNNLNADKIQTNYIPRYKNHILQSLRLECNLNIKDNVINENELFDICKRNHKLCELNDIIFTKSECFINTILSNFKDLRIVIKVLIYTKSNIEKIINFNKKYNDVIIFSINYTNYIFLKNQGKSILKLIENHNIVLEIENSEKLSIYDIHNKRINSSYYNMVNVEEKIIIDSLNVKNRIINISHFNTDTIYEDTNIKYKNDNIYLYLLNKIA